MRTSHIVRNGLFKLALADAGWLSGVDRTLCLKQPIERQVYGGICDLGKNVSRVSQNSVPDRGERGHP